MPPARGSQSGRCGEIGRHEGLKIPFWRQSTGSTPVGGIQKACGKRCAVFRRLFLLLLLLMNLFRRGAALYRVLQNSFR